MKRILLRNVLPIFLALAVLGGVLWILFTNKSGNPDKENHARSTEDSSQSILSGLRSLFTPEIKIKSDGMSYRLSTVEAIPIETEIPEEDPLLPVIGDRETLLKLLLERGALYDNSRRSNRSYIIYDDALDSAPMPFGEIYDADAPMALAEPTIVAGGDESAFSRTNEQVAGVSEGDIVKTDGRYIYAMSPYGSTLRIIRADGAELEIVSKITCNDTWGAEFYLIGKDRLAIVGQEYVPVTMLPMPYYDDRVEPDAPVGTEIYSEESYYDEYNYYGRYSNNFTILLIYDISDRANPTELRRISMDGTSVSTRVIGDVIYLITNKSIWYIPYEEADSSNILPYCRDTYAGELYAPISFERMYYIPDTDDCSYMLIGAIDVYRDDPFEPAAYLGAGSNFYMSRYAMYITKYRYSDTLYGKEDDAWRSWREMTDVLRFAVNGTKVTYTSMGTVPGSPINQYSMDEFNGYFRIATTDWSTGTYVTVLDASDMRTTGRTEPLAPGENMRSMRFVGDMGYVVTYRNMDPLFTIDLSDPYNPKILGELKIPGFSQYLHPVGDGLMLGIGRDTVETYTRDSQGIETVISARDVGMKVSLFDVSDPFNPKEIDVLTLGEGWAEVCDNPRALMCDNVRNVYGFMTQNWSNSGWPVNALLLSIEKGRLSIAVSLTTKQYTNMECSRLCFIDDTLYIIHETGVEAYDYADYTRIGSIVF